MSERRLPTCDDATGMNALESLGHGVVVTDTEQRVLYMNPAATTLTGRRREDAVGLPLSAVMSCVDPADRQPAPIPPGGSDQGAGTFGSRLLLRADGSEVAISETTTVMHDSGGEPSGYVVCLQDARQLRDLAYQATHDPLTGLVNRREFERRLAAVVAEGQGSEVGHALCFVDLDGFKSINDHAGHAAGDAVLGRLAQSMRLVLRDGDTIGRLGGDEFGIILRNCPVDMAVQLADGLRGLVERVRLRWAGQTLMVRTSIGLVAIDGRTIDGGDAFRKADLACYLAKTSGRNAVHVYAGETWDHVRANRRRRDPPDAAE